MRGHAQVPADQQYSDFVAWVKGKGITVHPDQKYTDPEFPSHLVQVLVVPIDLILSILERPGVQYVSGDGCINLYEEETASPRKGSRNPAGQSPRTGSS